MKSVLFRMYDSDYEQCFTLEPFSKVVHDFYSLQYGGKDFQHCNRTQSES